MKKFIPVIVGVVAVGGFLWDRSETQQQLARLRTELGARHEQDAGARRRVATLANDVRLPLLARLTRESAPRQAEIEAAEPASSESSRAAQEAEPGKERPSGGNGVGDEARLRDSLEERLVVEDADPTWTVDAERRAESQFEAKLPPGSQVDAVECSATVCRIETTHDDGSAASSFVRSSLGATEDRPWNGSFVVGPVETLERDGTVRLAVYLMREEHELPAGEL